MTVFACGVCGLCVGKRLDGVETDKDERLVDRLACLASMKTVLNPQTFLSVSVAEAHNIPVPEIDDILKPCLYYQLWLCILHDDDKDYLREDILHIAPSVHVHT